MKRRIDNYSIGAGEPAFIIAEAGANHNRDFGMAKKLIDGCIIERRTAGLLARWFHDQCVDRFSIESVVWRAGRMSK